MVTSAIAAPADEQVQRPARYAVACIDRTSSLPPWFIDRSLQYVARQVEDAVTGPMQRAVFHLRSISSNSYAPEAEIKVVQLDAVPMPPPRPTPSANPFLAQQDRQHAEAYERAHEAWVAGLNASRTFARRAAADIRALKLPADTQGTDVLGCLLRAPSLLGSEGERSLFVASDLVAHGRQQDSGPPPGSLSGVGVTIAFYCADLASACAPRVASFTDVLRQAGATDITVVDPQQLGG